MSERGGGPGGGEEEPLSAEDERLGKRFDDLRVEREAEDRRLGRGLRGLTPRGREARRRLADREAADRTLREAAARRAVEAATDGDMGLVPPPWADKETEELPAVRGAAPGDGDPGAGRGEHGDHEADGRGEHDEHGGHHEHHEHHERTRVDVVMGQAHSLVDRLTSWRYGMPNMGAQSVPIGRELESRYWENPKHREDPKRRGKFLPSQQEQFFHEVGVRLGLDEEAQPVVVADSAIDRTRVSGEPRSWKKMPWNLPGEAIKRMAESHKKLRTIADGQVPYEDLLYPVAGGAGKEFSEDEAKCLAMMLRVRPLTREEIKAIKKDDKEAEIPLGEFISAELVVVPPVRRMNEAGEEEIVGAFEVEENRKGEKEYKPSKGLKAWMDRPDVRVARPPLPVAPEYTHRKALEDQARLMNHRGLGTGEIPVPPAELPVKAEGPVVTTGPGAETIGDVRARWRASGAAADPAAELRGELPPRAPEGAVRVPEPVRRPMAPPRVERGRGDEEGPEDRGGGSGSRPTPPTLPPLPRGGGGEAAPRPAAGGAGELPPRPPVGPVRSLRPSERLAAEMRPAASGAGGIPPRPPEGPPALPEKERQVERPESYGAMTQGAERRRGVGNEDAVLTRPEAGLLAVFDGMGGYAGGAEASRLAVQEMEESLTRPGGEPRATRLRQAVLQAHRTINEELNSSPLIGPNEGAGTTASVIWMEAAQGGERHGLAENVGDSRVYILRAGGSLEMVTLDHSYSTGKLPSEQAQWEQQQRLADVVDKSTLSGGDRAAFDKRNEIAAALGNKARLTGAEEPRQYRFVLQPGDTIFATTDGIHDNLTNAEIRAVAAEARSGDELAQNLVRAARERSQERGHDRSKDDDMSAVGYMMPGNPRPAVEAGGSAAGTPAAGRPRSGRAAFPGQSGYEPRPIRFEPARPAPQPAAGGSGARPPVGPPTPPPPWGPGGSGGSGGGPEGPTPPSGPEAPVTEVEVERARRLLAYTDVAPTAAVRERLTRESGWSEPTPQQVAQVAQMERGVGLGRLRQAAGQLRQTVLANTETYYLEPTLRGRSESSALVDMADYAYPGRTEAERVRFRDDLLRAVATPSGGLSGEQAEVWWNLVNTGVGREVLASLRANKLQPRQAGEAAAALWERLKDERGAIAPAELLRLGRAFAQAGEREDVDRRGVTVTDLPTPPEPVPEPEPVEAPLSLRQQEQLRIAQERFAALSQAGAKVDPRLRLARLQALERDVRERYQLMYADWQVGSDRDTRPRVPNAEAQKLMAGLGQALAEVRQAVAALPPRRARPAEAQREAGAVESSIPRERWPTPSPPMPEPEVKVADSTTMVDGEIEGELVGDGWPQAAAGSQRRADIVDAEVIDEEGGSGIEPALRQPERLAMGMGPEGEAIAEREQDLRLLDLAYSRELSRLEGLPTLAERQEGLNRMLGSAVGDGFMRVDSAAPYGVRPMDDPRNPGRPDPRGEGWLEEIAASEAFREPGDGA